MNLQQLGKIILIFGIVILIVGAILYFLGKGFNLPRLPLDISYSKGGFHFWFPLGTCLIISIALTILINLILFFLRK